MQLRRRRPAAAGNGATDGGPWIVLGLGNPDAEGYANTRHNAGAMVVAPTVEAEPEADEAAEGEAAEGAEAATAEGAGEGEDRTEA